jgi:multidrug efflux system membrane fusion protein
LSVDAYDRSQLTKIASGKLLTLDNQIDSSTGTVRFRGQFENADLTLFPNQFVNARLLVRTRQSVVLVPGAAVQHNGTQAFVYVISNATARLHPVSELGTDGDRTGISGLNEGDVVAITGFDKLENGSKVLVQDQPASSTPYAQSGAGQ